MTIAEQNRPMGRLLLIIAFIAFISLGLPDGLLGVAWPSMSTSFNVDLSVLSVALVAGTIGYMVSTVLSGKLVALLGIGRLLALSSFLTASALIAYTIIPSFVIVLGCVVIAGFGGGAIDAGVNIYITEKYRKMLYWLHAMFGIGTTIGPFVMTASLNISTWRLGYLLVGSFQLVLAAIFLLTADRWEMVSSPSETETEASSTQPGLRETLRIPATWFSILLFMLYAGLEVSFGQWSFSIFSEGRGIDANLAGYFVGVYWGSFTVGRILSSFIVMRVPERRYLRFGMGMALVGALLMWWNPFPMIGLLGLPLVGFAFAPIFPALVGTTENRVGKRHMANTIGFQIGAAGLGMAVIPGFGGFVTSLISVEAITLLHLVGVVVLWIIFERVEPKQKKPA